MTPPDKLTSPAEILKTIAKTNKTNAPGKDRSQYKTRNMLPRKIVFSYIICLKNQYYPQEYKEARIISTLKPKKKLSAPES